MEKKGTIRRSRRLRERGRREKKEGRKSVGDDLGVTPIRGKAVNLAEARATQDGERILPVRGKAARVFALG